MTFNATDGTRGARQPGGRFMRWVNRWMTGRIRRTGKMPFLGFDALVLTTIGRKSGLERVTPVGWFPGKDGSWLIVASAAGAAKNPDWYHNLAAHPDRVQIELAGRKVAVTAEQLNGAEREEAWRAIAAASAQFAQYQQKTDRVLPIIRLTPRG
ncbi:MAG: nitroreductase/quinone reductase family protein [Polyangiaceae bacterium]